LRVARTVEFTKSREQLGEPVSLVERDALHLHVAGGPDHEVGPLVAKDPAQPLHLFRV
jgi:hypothetical protein